MLATVPAAGTRARPTPAIPPLQAATHEPRSTLQGRQLQQRLGELHDPATGVGLVADGSQGAARRRPDASSPDGMQARSTQDSSPVIRFNSAYAPDIEAANRAGQPAREH